MTISKIYPALFVLSAVFLSSCFIFNQNYSRNWQDSDLPGHIYASFDQFNGTQDFNAQKFAGKRMLVKYSTEIKEGQLHIEIVCDHKIVLSRDVSASVKDSVGFDNPDHNPVKFIFKAKKAAGKFDITY